MSLFKSNTAIIATFALSLMISATDTQAQTPPQEPLYTEYGVSISYDMKNAFEVAELLYPGLFRTRSILREFEGYAYRYYRDSGNYIGYKDGEVFLMGVNFPSSTQPIVYGNLNDILPMLLSEYDRRFPNGTWVPEYPDQPEDPNEPGNPDIPEIPEGDFNLTVTGKATVSLPIIGAMSFDIPPITFTEIPAPDLSDMDEIERALLEQADLQNIKHAELILKEHSDNRIVFDIEVEADFEAPGYGVLSATYLLHYVYVRM